MQSLPADRVLTSDAPALQVAFLDGGKTLAARCGDGKIRLWDAVSGEPRQASGEETGALFKDRSRFSAHRSVDRRTSVNTIRVRDRAGKELFALPAGIGGIAVHGFSPDDGFLVVGSYDTDLRVWKVSNGELVQRIDSLPVAMFAMEFSPDGSLLATAGADRTIYLWDVQTWKLARTIRGQPEMISALVFSPGGNRIVTGGFSELTENHPVQLIVWDAASGGKLRTMPAPRRVTALAFSPDGKQIASAYGARTLNLWQSPA
jgi:WD40 repeat protein